MPNDEITLIRIVGIEKADCGRSCAFHSPCGDYLETEKEVTFRKTTFDNKPAVQVLCVLRGNKPCIVGWISKEDLKDYAYIDWDNKRGVLTKFLHESVDSDERHYSYVKNTAAEVRLENEQM
jgi:hypothetical protein